MNRNRVFAIVLGAASIYGLQCSSLKALEAVGPQSLSNKTFKEPLKVVGPLTATKLITEQLNVTGPATLTVTTVKGKAHFTGPLTAKKTHFMDTVKVVGPLDAYDSQFKKQVTVTGNHADFNGCELESLVIKNRTGRGDQQTSSVATSYHQTTVTSYSFLDTIKGWFGIEKAGPKKVVIRSESSSQEIVPTVRLKNSTVHGTITFEGEKGELIVDTKSRIDEKKVSGAVIKKEK